MSKLDELTEMLQTGTVTKLEIMQRLNLDEREARRTLSDAAKTHPLIATSSAEGYRIAVTPQDLEEVRHAFNENRKRAAEILKRNIPLERFIHRHGGKA